MDSWDSNIQRLYPLFLAGASSLSNKKMPSKIAVV
jgi:hypothetical protein